MNSLDPITQADLDALAALANTKLTPATDYAFAPFAGADRIALPTDAAAVPMYGSGSFVDRDKVTLRIYGYKTIGGKITYTNYFRRAVFVGALGSGSFTLDWSWPAPVGPTAPEGYIVVVPRLSSGWEYFWKDLGALTTATTDGAFTGWNADFTLDAANLGNTAQNLPCGRGAWLKVLNAIRADLFSQMDIGGGSAITFTDDFLVSGPWCVSVAPKCYLHLEPAFEGLATGINAYRDLKFIYSESDSATGNQLAPEFDLLGFIGANNGANDFNWNVDVTVNGRVLVFSDPGETFADWTVTASHPGIAISFDPNYFDNISSPGRTLSAFIFDFTEVVYETGTPIVLTCTPPSGHSVTGAGDPVGGGGYIHLVATADTDTYDTTDTAILHRTGIVGKAAALPSSLDPVTFTDPLSTATDFPAHYRAFCDGVFVAKTLPTMGVMPYLDVDLPQYDPQDSPASSRRAARNDALDYLPVVENKAALWPVMRDTDFTPDAIAGRPFTGSRAWNALATRNVSPQSFTDAVPPTGAGSLWLYSVFVSEGADDMRVYVSDPTLTVYLRASAAPTAAVYDATFAGGAWYSTKDSLPGFATNTTWFIGVFNPAGADVTATTRLVVVQDGTLPNGTFFPTLPGFSRAPLLEGQSYHFNDDNIDEQRPIPLYGYCIYLVTVSRPPAADTAADLVVALGIMEGFGFDAAGVFTELQTVTIPAGEMSATVEVFWPVLAGNFLVYQCAELVSNEAAVNFQPMMHSLFSADTEDVGGSPYLVGHYDGNAWFNTHRALLFFEGGFFYQPILLPICAAVYNDLTAALDLV